MRKHGQCLCLSSSLSPSLSLSRSFSSEIYTTALQTPNQHKKYRNTSGKITQNVREEGEGRCLGGREREKQSIAKKYLYDELPTRHCLFVSQSVCPSVSARLQSIFSRIHFPLSVFHFHEVLVRPC